MEGITVKNALKNHIPMLTKFCADVFDSITSTRDRLPGPVENLSKLIYMCAYQKDPTRVYAAVGDGLFVRLFCPALFQFISYGVAPEGTVLSADVKAVLLVVAKVLQNLSLGVYFDYSIDPDLVPFNNFIDNNTEVFTEYCLTFKVCDRKIFFFYLLFFLAVTRPSLCCF